MRMRQVKNTVLVNRCPRLDVATALTKIVLPWTVRDMPHSSRVPITRVMSETTYLRPADGSEVEVSRRLKVTQKLLCMRGPATDQSPTIMSQRVRHPFI